jgi:hypothetical protein
VDDLLSPVGGEPEGGHRALPARAGKDRDAAAGVGAEPPRHVGRSFRHEDDIGAARDVRVGVVGRGGMGFVHEADTYAVLPCVDMPVRLYPIAE